MCRTRSLRVIKRLRLKSIRRVKLRLPTGKSKKERKRAREREHLSEKNIYILKTEESIEEYITNGLRTEQSKSLLLLLVREKSSSFASLEALGFKTLNYSLEEILENSKDCHVCLLNTCTARIGKGRRSRDSFCAHSRASSFSSLFFSLFFAISENDDDDDGLSSSSSSSSSSTTKIDLQKEKRYRPRRRRRRS